MTVSGHIKKTSSRLNENMRKFYCKRTFVRTDTNVRFFLSHIQSLTLCMNIEFHRANHVFRIQNSVQVFLGKNAFFQNQLVHTLTGFQRLLGNGGGMVVTDIRIQGGYHTDAIVHFFYTFGFIGGNTIASRSAPSGQPRRPSSYTIHFPSP